MSPIGPGLPIRVRQLMTVLLTGSSTGQRRMLTGFGPEQVQYGRTQLQPLQSKTERLQQVGLNCQMSKSL
jgi:hypothetical protein